MKYSIENKLSKTAWAALSVLMISAGAAGCKSMNKTQKGVVIGSAGGAVLGAGVGKAAGNTAVGAIIGAAVGGVTGGIIGRKMDKQAEEIDNIPGAEVKRVGEGINVTFDSGVLFGFDQSNLTTPAAERISELAGILKKYPDTYIRIEGHTDDQGAHAYNERLSKRRAQSVADFLKQQNITGNRIRTAWYGEDQPKFDNSSEENRAKNRRVEFAIYANEKMVEAAKKEAGN
ncbi:OmpA family protein [Flavihumibacter sp. CACIAM 22H1]|uniref:OmpA family protein n=1 Tax=Flavihumibacter sp. CACIAM 22H1 TaxID=1812911 RepID=UPI000A9104A4|nr:OmpA family protein [Flavihumibacter sp. CACIAM 22H1]